MSGPAQVQVLQPGYAVWSEDGKSQKADGTITLVRAEKNVLIDTGLPKDKDELIRMLADVGLGTADIDVVLCTHGDADHIGNINLFPNAQLIVGFDIYTGDTATFFQKNYPLCAGVTATEMVGHDDRSIGVLVETEQGVVAITGDLFERDGDWQDVTSWLAFSKNPKLHVKTRARVWELADYIVPGHGDMFKVDKARNILAAETAALATLLKSTPNVYGDTVL